MRKKIAATAPWLFLIGGAILEQAGVGAQPPDAVTILLCAAATCITLSIVIADRIDAAIRRAPAILEAFDHAYQLHQRHCADTRADLRSAASGMPHAVGETTTMAMPGLRLVQPAQHPPAAGAEAERGTVYTSRSATGERPVTRLAAKRPPAPRRNQRD